jgi:large subunit ribosomal protein L10
MDKTEKERVVGELVEKLKATDTLLVADYRGLTNKQLEALRARLVEHGARFSIVKNTLTRRAAEEAGTEPLLTLLDGPTAIAFIESDGDPAAAAKALADTARETNVLALRGGILQGAAVSGEQVAELAKLPPLDVLRGQLAGAIVAPLTQLAAVLAAPLRDFVGLIDARIEQLGGAFAGAEAPSADEPSPATPTLSADEETEDTGEQDMGVSAEAGTPEGEEE